MEKIFLSISEPFLNLDTFYDTDSETYTETSRFGSYSDPLFGINIELPKIPLLGEQIFFPFSMENDIKEQILKSDDRLFESITESEDCNILDEIEKPFGITREVHNYKLTLFQDVLDMPKLSYDSINYDKIALAVAKILIRFKWIVKEIYYVPGDDRIFIKPQVMIGFKESEKKSAKGETLYSLIRILRNGEYE